MIQYLINYFDNYMPKEKRLSLGYAKQVINFTVDIDDDGNFLGINSLTKDPKERLEPVVVPDDGSPETSGANPHFLWGKLKYFFLYKNKKDGSDKTFDSKIYFEASKNFHLSLLQKLADEGNASAKAVCKFFEKESSIQHVFTEEDIKLYGSNLFAFRHNNKYLYLDRNLLKSWDEKMEEGEKVFSAFSGCESRKLDGPHPQLNPSEIPGTGSGAPLVSRKDDVPAFELEMPLPVVSQLDVHKYITALKYLATEHEMRESKIVKKKKKSDKKKTSKKNLLADEEAEVKVVNYPYFFYRTKIADDFVLIHWVEDKEKLDFNIFDRPEMLSTSMKNEELKDVLQRLCSGLGFKNWDKNPITHIFGLVGTTGRIRVVFSAHEFLNDIVENAVAHLERIRIVGLSRYPSFYSILNTVLPEGGNIKQFHNLAQGVVLAIMTGTRYPEYLYNALLEKIKTGVTSDKMPVLSDGKLTFDFKNCVSILKAILIKNYGMEVTFKLNEFEKSTAYLLGRVFATAWLSVDKNHRANMDKVVDRWFRVAMETPALAYAQYLQSARIHGVRDGKIAEIMKDIKEPYPERLSIRDQGMWTIGFYHQVAKQFKIGEPKENDGDTNADVEETVNDVNEENLD